MAHLLIVDDEASICWGFQRLARDMGHSADTAASAEEGLSLAQKRRPHAIVLDVRLPGMDGIAAMHHFRQACGPVPTIVVTAHGDLNTAVEAVRQGASDYLTKPFELAQVRSSIERALVPSTKSTARAGPTVEASASKLLGESPPMQTVFKSIALAAASDIPVHIHGESGTGKELVARAIHGHSRRSAAPFVAVNVAAVSPTLAESELFGHVRGAFTGADTARDGLLKAADGGIVFLDEVADMPLPTQAKLLRALEHGEFLPVGATQPVASDFRLLSATHRNLADEVTRGRFRHDLFFRINTFTIEVPPLRQRPQDIPLLVDHFLDMSARRDGTPRPILAAEALAELTQRPWHGNVRELRNAVELASARARGQQLTPSHFPPPIALPASAPSAGGHGLAAAVRRWTLKSMAESRPPSDLHAKLLAEVEAPLIELVLEHTGGNCVAAASILGLHRTTVRRKLDRDAASDAG